MRVISHQNLNRFWTKHPDAMVGLTHWYKIVRKGEWHSPLEVVQSVPGSKALNHARIRFAIHGGNYRLIASFDFRFAVAYVKFIGTHAEYDKIDALNVEQF
ncbi:MAG: type II toxin-antitoxin system HigB family toxin [Devosia sp.]